MKKLFFKMKLHNRMMLLVLLITTFIFFMVIWFMATQNREIEVTNAEKLAESMGANYANSFSEYLNYSMDITRMLAKNSQVFIEAGNPERIVLDKLLEKTLQENSEFLAVWTRWEPNAFDNSDSNYIAGQWGTLSGILDINYYYDNGKMVRYVDMTTEPEDEENIEYGPYISIPKETKQEAIIEPYYYSYSGNPEDNILMTTTSVPVVIDGVYRGVLAIDIGLEQFSDIINQIRLYDNGFGKLISFDGNLVSHPRIRFIGNQSYEFRNSETEIIKAIQNGDSYISSGYSHDLGYNTLRIYTPIKIGNSPTPWSFAIEIPVSEIEEAANQRLKKYIILGLSALIILLLIIWQIARFIMNPVIKTTKSVASVLDTISKGDLDNTKTLKTGKEENHLSQIAQTTNNLLDGLKKTFHFAQKIGEGDLESEYKLLSNNDQIGRALLNMQESLVKAKIEASKRTEEDKKRRWATEGYAKFAELLRADNDNIETLCYKIIKNLVEYLNANQGGIFILNEENENDKHLQLMACFAYDRRKYLEKKIEIGEGLVGACYMEGKSIILTEIPESYIKITSGLGEKNPDFIILAPLKINENVNGVLEIASIKKLEPYQIEFIEKMGETIASTIHSLKINLNTVALLEKSQKQAEEMESQEYEMRQNMEELIARQEELEEKSNQINSIFNALDSTSFIIEYDLKGYVKRINKTYLEFLHITEKQALGMHHSDNLLLSDKQKGEYNKFWQDILNGKSVKQETKINFNGKTKYIAEAYTLMHDKDDKPYRVFKIAIDITDKKSNNE